MTPFQVKSLNEKAILVHLGISMFTGRRKDKSVTGEVCHIKKADVDAGSWWTYLVPKKALDPVNAARMRCRNVFFKYTLPWMDGSIRILPAVRFTEYREAIKKAIADYEQAVSLFISLYPNLIKDAPTRLGKLANTVRIPSVSEIRNAFAVHHHILPIPNTADFRVDIGDAEIKDITNKAAKAMEDMTYHAMEEVWKQLGELVGKIGETMSQPKKIFRDTLIGNLKDYCELIPKLNLTEDMKLEAVRKEVINKLTTLKPDTLRESKDDRKKAAKAAKDMLEKINSLGTRAA